MTSFNTTSILRTQRTFTEALKATRPSDRRAFLGSIAGQDAAEPFSSKIADGLSSDYVVTLGDGAIVAFGADHAGADRDVVIHTADNETGTVVVSGDEADTGWAVFTSRDEDGRLLNLVGTSGETNAVDAVSEAVHASGIGYSASDSYLAVRLTLDEATLARLEPETDGFTRFEVSDSDGIVEVGRDEIFEDADAA